MKFTYRFCFPNYDRFVVDASGCHGGLVLFWSLDMNINILSYFHSHIEVTILNYGNHPL